MPIVENFKRDPNWKKRNCSDCIYNDEGYCRALPPIFKEYGSTYPKLWHDCPACSLFEEDKK